MLLHFIHCRALLFCWTCYSFRCSCQNFSQIFRFGFWFVFRMQNLKDLKDLKLCYSFSNHLVLFHCIRYNFWCSCLNPLAGFLLWFLFYIKSKKFLKDLFQLCIFRYMTKKYFFDFVFFDIWQVAARWLRASCWIFFLTYQLSKYILTC